MMRVSARRLAACVAVVTAGAVALIVPGSAGASPELPVTTATSVPTDEAGHGKVVVAFAEGVIPAGTLGALRNLGVERAIELPTIGAVAVTADLPVVDLLGNLPGVVAVEPQRRLVSYLYASKKQINAIGVHHPGGWQAGDRDPSGRDRCRRDRGRSRLGHFCASPGLR